MANEFTGVIEEWKAEYILKRAIKRRFPPHEIHEVQQEAVLALKDFRYDPEKSNGASEMTVFKGLVNRQLALQLRARTRHRRLVEDYGKLRKPDEECPDHAPRFDLEQDVQNAIKKLHPRQRAVAKALESGLCRHQITKTLDISRYEVDRIIEGIQERFEKWGLNSMGQNR